MFLDDEIAFAKTRRSSLKPLISVALIAVLGVFITLTSLAHSALAGEKISPLLTPNGVNMGSLLLPSQEPGYYVEAPRLKADVQIDVTGPILRAKVTQRFQNPGKGWVEGTYVFPLPEDSAVDSLRMQIGDRFIEGKIKPREEAREIYEQAKREGTKAALLEQQRPNIFTNQVANIGPGETIVVQIEYQETVHQTNGEFSFRFPMVVAPRYSPMPVVQNVRFGDESGFAVAEDSIKDLDKITAPVLDPRDNAKINPVTLTVNLNAGFALGDVTSPHHKINISADGLDGKTITLNTDEVPADQDFELTWKAAPGKTPAAGLFREQGPNGKDYLLAFVTPPSLKDDNAPAPKREAIFIIDNSGSMGGESIKQAKASLELAIAALKPEDRFNVIRFDDTMTVYFPQLEAADDQHKQDAIAYVRSLQAEGGTEMLPALKAALSTQGPVADGALRQVIFLTDGAIGNESDLFGEIARNRDDARVFTVGIGSAPNSYFMTKAAEIGRGTYTHIGSEDQISERMIALFNKLENPVMTDITARLESGSDAEITPDPVPDLYAGEPIVLTAVIPTGENGELNITGQANGQPWRTSLDLSKAAKGSGIGKLWARRKIADLEATPYTDDGRQNVDAEIEKVALEHHLVSRMTSLVAVDVSKSRPDDEQLDRTKMPLNLPAGWDFDKVYGEVSAPAPADKSRGITLAQVQNIAKMAANSVAQAPTAEAASIVATRTKSVALPQTSTLADRDILLGLMMLAFALMGGCLLFLSRSGLKTYAKAWGWRDE
ncbi:marine proteobacterial sortase target protein [Rhizobium sp. L1K21]|uniref:marine proteobacterial sortase target protein n=1 Tax=Rhizobium sp. L1K21 TaxID=2954933 RepID=UPI00209365D9|nr:marine proteobacterial sortase target protein [Rhizobium sp. L1K21]MCO6185491.1 marine proteobacterial sortase target protein [Rhizobium sp. L1K21]